MGSRFKDFVFREWLFSGAAVSLLLSSLYLKHWPHYTWKDLRPIFLLWILFVVIKGLERSRLLCRIARYAERGAWLAPRMVLLSFFLSMFLTIDVSLVALLPLLLGMRISHKVPLAILVALTAHAGAALTPFGTPQNLFIFNWYGLETWEFLRVMSPFAFGLFLLYLLASLLFPAAQLPGEIRQPRPLRQTDAFVYLLFFLLGVGAVLGFIPLLAGALVLLYAYLVDFESLKVDYALLATFAVFVGLTDNIRQIVDGSLAQIGHTYYLSAVMSQFISNVPTALILERFTEHWRSLLWGTNAGGYGTFVAALANLIAYKLFIAYGEAKDLRRFSRGYLIAGFFSLLAATALHWIFFDFIHYYPE
ncbi:SLC13 family permease [Nitratifractor sp.]